MASRIDIHITPMIVLAAVANQWHVSLTLMWLPYLPKALEHFVAVAQAALASLPLSAFFRTKPQGAVLILLVWGFIASRRT